MLISVFFGLLLVITEVGIPDYIANSSILSEIWVFWAICIHQITLCVIVIHNIRFLEPLFTTLWPLCLEVFGSELMKSEKIFSKYLTSFFGCCRRSNIWFTLLSLSPSFIWDIWTRIKWWTRLNFPFEIFGCGENERQSSKILNVIVHW